jgi:hypothetical protein
MARRGMFGSGIADFRTVARFKELFFDRVEIESKTEAAAVKIQSRFGAYVRRRAQTSMRRRKSGHSAPGSPPFARSGEMRKLLFFGYDPSTKSTVIGPAGFGKKPGEVPGVHEFGGTLPGGSVPVVTAFSRIDTGLRLRIIHHARRAKMRVRDYLRTHHHLYPEIEGVRNVTRNYPARPYMRPALKAELPNFAGLFRDSIK